MDDAIDRIEKKVDSVNSEIRALIGGIHEQSLSIVKLCEQMKSSTEAVGRAHGRIDSVNDKVEVLRELPARMDCLEKQVDHQGRELGRLSTATVGNANRVTQREAVSATLTRFAPWLVIGAVASALIVLGGVLKVFG